MLVFVRKFSSFFADFFCEIFVGETDFDFFEFFPSGLDFFPLYFAFRVEKVFPGFFFVDDFGRRSSHFVVKF